MEKQPFNIYRNNLHYADLEPVIGSEQGGVRPVLIIQNDLGNKHSPTVIVAPLTNLKNDKQNIPTHVIIKSFAKIRFDSIILLEQIRVIDKSRLKSFLGKVDEEKMKEVDKALAIAIGLEKNKRSGEDNNV